MIGWRSFLTSTLIESFERKLPVKISGGLTLRFSISALA
jgi:hypothetical protein